MSFNELSPEELCNAYREELRRLYEDERADKSVVSYGKGWYYIGVARRFDDGSVGYPLTSPYRKKQVIEMIQNLRKREPNDR